MPGPSKSIQELEQSQSAPDAAAIRLQLERLLIHPLFANSKRYPALLGYVVEQTLLGNASELKERSIGIEVFGRSPSYDANADPVVRITAGEVRKRLSQYYYDSSHAGELVIELPIGSYVPLVRSQEQAASPVELESIAAIPEPTVPALPVLPGQPQTSIAQPRPHQPWRIRWLVAALFVVLSGALGLGIGLRYRVAPAPANPPSNPQSNIDRFWAPII